MRSPIVLCVAVLFAMRATGQFEMQHSGTTASLRGIDAVGNGVAWTSGTGGTVLRTVDGGKTWEHCAVPEGAEALDFRGVQAFDEKTAIVMSSGKGDLSRLYKTVDGCKSWKLVFRNPDKDGFWDAIQASEPDHIVILGDSVAGKLQLWEWNNSDDEPQPAYIPNRNADADEGSFAASNSVLDVPLFPQHDASSIFTLRWSSGEVGHSYMNLLMTEHTKTCEPCREELKRVNVPLSGSTATTGIFSFRFRTERVGIAVGGDYERPEDGERTAAFSQDGGMNWKLALHAPRGYRSSVEYDIRLKTWITVGPNGTDVSTDDGKNWRPLRPGAGDDPGADRDWNALSLPFVVGPKGRIGVLRAAVLGAK